MAQDLKEKSSPFYRFNYVKIVLHTTHYNIMYTLTRILPSHGSRVFARRTQSLLVDHYTLHKHGRFNGRSNTRLEVLQRHVVLKCMQIIMHTSIFYETGHRRPFQCFSYPKQTMNYLSILTVASLSPRTPKCLQIIPSIVL